MRWRLWLSRFFCPHGYAVVRSPEPVGELALKITVDTRGVYEALDTLAYRLGRMSEAIRAAAV